MRTDTEVRVHGLRALVEALGTVEAERFITLMLREPFDYTNWQRQLWADKSVDEISQAAMALRRAAPSKGLEPTPNSFRSCVAPAIGRGSPRAFGVSFGESFRNQDKFHFLHLSQNAWIIYSLMTEPNATLRGVS